MSDNNIKLSIDIADNLVEVQKRMESTQKIVDKLKNRLKNLKEEQKVVNAIFNEGKLSQAEYEKESKKLDSAIKNVNNNLSSHTQALASVKVENTQLEKSLNNTVIAEQVLNNLTGKTTQTLSDMQSQFAALKDIPLDGLSSGQIEKVGQAISELNGKIIDTKVKIESLDTNKVFENIGGGLKVVAESTNILITGLSTLGVESETLNKLQENTNKLISVTQSLAAVTEFLTKKKHLLLLASIQNAAASVKNAIVLKAEALAYLILGKSADAASKSFIRLRAVFISTGIGAAIALVTGLVYAINKLSTSSNQAARDQKMHNDAVKSASSTIGNQLAQYRKLQIQWKGLNGSLSEQTKFVNKNKDAFHQLGVKVNNVKEAENILVTNSKAFIDAMQKRALAAAYMEVASEQYKQYIENLDKAENVKSTGTYKWIKFLVGSDEKTEDAIKESFLKKAEQNKEDADKIINTWANFEEKSKNALENINITPTNDSNDELLKQKEIADKEQLKQQQESFLKKIDLKQKEQEALIKAEKNYQSENFAIRQYYDKLLFDSKQEAELKKLKAQKEFGDITQKEYETQYSTLESQAKEFQNIQEADTKKHFQEQEKNIKSLLGQTITDEIKAVESQYNQAIQSLQLNRTIKTPDGASSWLKDKDTEELLVKERNKKIAALRKQGEEQTINESVKKWEEYFKTDLQNAENNEIAKLMIRKRIFQNAANENSTTEFDGEIQKIDEQLIDANVRKGIAISRKSSEEIYQIERKTLEDKLKLYDENSVEYAETLQEIRNLDDKFFQSEQEKWLEYTNTIKEAFAGVFELLNTLGQVEVARVEEENNAKKESLQAQLDAGAISQREYNKQVEQADKDLDKKKADIARKQAIREKALKAFEIGINTATAVMKIWAEVPKADFGISTAILTAAAIAMGAVQLATVLAAPLPKAAKGGLIQGASHAQGGVVLEAEGGEYIVNKRAAKANMPLLQSINQAGAIPFLNAGSDGGFSQREYQRRSPQNIDYDMLAERIAGEFKNVQIYTNITDIDNMHKKMNLTDLDNTNF